MSIVARVGLGALALVLAASGAVGDDSTIFNFTPEPDRVHRDPLSDPECKPDGGAGGDFGVGDPADMGDPGQSCEGGEG